MRIRSIEPGRRIAFGLQHLTELLERGEGNAREGGTVAYPCHAEIFHLLHRRTRRIRQDADRRLDLPGENADALGIGYTEIKDAVSAVLGIGVASLDRLGQFK